MFREVAVSVTCSTEADGAASWWLTKGSRQVPVGAESRTHIGAEERRGAHVIYQRAVCWYPYQVVFVGQFCADALRAVRRAAAVESAHSAWFAGAGAGGSYALERERYRSLCHSLGRGAYSSGDGCTCGSEAAIERGTACARCLGVRATERMFVQHDARSAGLSAWNERQRDLC